MLVFKRLEELRDAKNYSQQQLADIVGRTREWYANILRTKNMRVDDLEKIANHFNLPIIYFFEEDSESDIRFSLVEEPAAEFHRGISRNEMGFLMKELALLKEQLEKKDGQIEFLQRIIEDMTDKD